MTHAIDLGEVTFAHGIGMVASLDGINLTVCEGETVALCGPSGAGKTTLLTLLDGRLRGWRGRVSVVGSPLSPDCAPPASRRADTGFVFQEFALVERTTVRRNVLNGRLGRMPPLPAFLGLAVQNDLSVVERALADCGISDLADRRVDTLSGGQRQRVAIARCLAQEPRLILADEPISNLDPARAAEILTLLTDVGRARGATTLFTSHQPELARRFSERVIGMRNGRIVFDSPVAELTDDAAAMLYRDTDTTAAARLQLVC